MWGRKKEDREAQRDRCVKNAGHLPVQNTGTEQTLDAQLLHSGKQRDHLKFEDKTGRGERWPETRGGLPSEPP